MNTLETSETIQFLTFTLDEEDFAVNITKVREVLDYTKITKVPRSPEFMLGVLNLRGSVVPVIDMRLKFGISKTDITINTSIIILEIMLDDETTILGALVDSVQEVIELGPDQIGPPPRIGTRLKTEFIHGMGKRDDKFIIILDINKVFSVDELILGQVDESNNLLEQTTENVEAVAV